MTFILQIRRGKQFTATQCVGSGSANSAAHGHELLVKWVGFDYNQATWEPMDNCANCPDLVADYFRNKHQTGATSRSPEHTSATPTTTLPATDYAPPSSPESDLSDSSTLPVVCLVGYKWCRCPHHTSPRFVRAADIDDRFCCKLGCNAHTEDVRDSDGPDTFVEWVALS